MSGFSKDFNSNLPYEVCQSFLYDTCVDERARLKSHIETAIEAAYKLAKARRQEWVDLDFRELANEFYRDNPRLGPLTSVTTAETPAQRNADFEFKSVQREISAELTNRFPNQVAVPINGTSVFQKVTGIGGLLPPTWEVAPRGSFTSFEFRMFTGEKRQF